MQFRYLVLMNFLDFNTINEEMSFDNPICNGDSIIFKDIYLKVLGVIHSEHGKSIIECYQDDSRINK